MSPELHVRSVNGKSISVCYKTMSTPTVYKVAPLLAVGASGTGEQAQKRCTTMFDKSIALFDEPTSRSTVLFVEYCWLMFVSLAGTRALIELRPNTILDLLILVLYMC